MKIESNSIHNGNHTMNTHQNRTGNFSSFINPTGNQSGDEYYWQHQHHLQSNELQFSILRRPELSSTGFILHTAPHRVGAKTTNIARSSNLAAKPQNVHTGSTEIPMGCIKKELPMSHRLFRESRNHGTNLDPEKSRNVKQWKKFQKNPNTPRLYPQSDLKKYRLCITENQAEITVRVFNSQRKEILNLIKKYLSNHRLNPRKIIINGVKQ